MWGPPRKVQIRRPFDHNSYITLITGRAISDDPFLRPDLESHRFFQNTSHGRRFFTSYGPLTNVRTDLFQNVREMYNTSVKCECK